MIDLTCKKEVASLTYQEKVAALDKALGWLNKRYPSKYVKVKTDYVDKPYVMKKGIGGFIIQDQLTFNITVAVGRDISYAMKTLFHEYKHLLQVAWDGKLYGQIGKAEEAEALQFSISEMNKYVDDVGYDW